MKTSHIVLLVTALFALALWSGTHAGGFPDGNRSFTMPDPGNMRWMAALDWTAAAVGVLIAAISAFRVLHDALRRARLPQILPAVVALFGGLLLYQRHWAVGMAMAAIMVAWVIIEYLRPSDKRDDHDKAA